jgi:beta-lactamase class A
MVVWGKTGSLPAIRNEIGVVEYPGGGRYAVAVFTRAGVLDQRLPVADHAIGEAARWAIESIRHDPPNTTFQGTLSGRAGRHCTTTG